MSVTFRVDDVEKAKVAPETRSLSEHLGEVLAFGGDAEARVLSRAADTHPLLAAVHLAFAEHRPLVLSPDAIWLTILSGVAHHVRLNAEALRPRFVRHQGKRTLSVTLNEPSLDHPAAVASAIGAFRSAIAEQVGDGVAALLTSDFTTTGEVERLASEIVLLDTFSPYFDLVAVCVCGIPEITLLGEPEDWRSIRARLDVIAEFDLDWWTSSLKAILDRFVSASEGNPESAFFRDIYKPEDAYGGEVVTGWAARFYPYIASLGRFDDKNPLLECALESPPGSPERASLLEAGVRTRDIPPAIGSATVHVQDLVRGEYYDLNLQGGLVAIELDAEGRLIPLAGWTARRATSSARGLVEAIRAREDVSISPPEVLAEEERRFGGWLLAERSMLCDALGEVRLFVGRGEWRLLPPSRQEDIALSSEDEPNLPLVKRMIELPDGTFLAYADRRTTRGYPISCVIRLAEAELEELPPAAPGDIVVISRSGKPTRRSRQQKSQIPVVADSLVEILASALRSNGAIELPVRAYLSELAPV